MLRVCFLAFLLSALTGIKMRDSIISLVPHILQQGRVCVCGGVLLKADPHPVSTDKSLTKTRKGRCQMNKTCHEQAASERQATILETPLNYVHCSVKWFDLGQARPQSLSPPGQTSRRPDDPRPNPSTTPAPRLTRWPDAARSSTGARGFRHP